LGLDFPLTHAERLEQLFEAVMAEADPQVVHFNQLIGLSPRFIEIAQRLRVAVVISLHDFWFACPLIHLRKPSGELCPGPDGGRNCGRTCFAHQRPHAALADPVLRWGLRTLYSRRLLNLAQRVICYSRYVASFFEGFGVNPAHVRLIPNGVTFEAAGPVTPGCIAPKERGALSLAYCGMVTPHKGPHVILEALRIADLGRVDLLVLGQGGQGQEADVSHLRERGATTAGLKMRRYGSYKRAELPHLLQGVDCVVVPSLVPEAGPIVPREALARGVPVVVARLGALPELVAEGENGFTFDPARPGELAAILRRLAWDESLLGGVRGGGRGTPVVTGAGHADAGPAVYRGAEEDLLHKGPPCGADGSETRFLHEALLGLRFGIDP